MQPPSGRSLPKCHVGCRCCVSSRLGAPPAGVLAPGCRPLGPLGLRTRVGKPVRGSGGARAALDRRRGGASRPRAALAEDAGTGGEPGAAAEAGRRQRAPLPPGEPAEMLAESVVEEFEVEEEPWYDNRDLQQGERAGGQAPEAPGGEPVKKLLVLAAHGSQVRAKCDVHLAWGAAAPAHRAPEAGPARAGAAAQVSADHACGGQLCARTGCRASSPHCSAARVGVAAGGRGGRALRRDACPALCPPVTRTTALREVAFVNPTFQRRKAEAGAARCLPLR